jgi:hypothetical protein
MMIAPYMFMPKTITAGSQAIFNVHPGVVILPITAKAESSLEKARGLGCA